MINPLSQFDNMTSDSTPQDLDKLKDQEYIYEKVHSYSDSDYIKNGARLITSIIRNFSLRPGSGMNNVQCPPELLKRMSVLEMYWSSLTPGARFVNVLKWFLNQQMYYPQQGLQDIKPYNPILGEEFYCSWTHEDSVSECKAEQVCHHPPISAVYMENKRYGFYFQQTIQPISTFYGTSVHTRLEGENLLKLVNLDEEYYYKDPEANMKNLIFGTARLELYKNMTLKCEQTGLYCVINFPTKPQNSVEGYIYQMNTVDGRKDTPIYKVSGNMKSEVFIESMDGKETYNLPYIGCPRCPEYKMEVKPVYEQSHKESRRVWHELTYGLMTKDLALAASGKARVENFERQLRKERPKDWTWESHFTAKHFTHTGTILDTSTPKFVYNNPLSKNEAVEQIEESMD